MKFVFVMIAQIQLNEKKKVCNNGNNLAVERYFFPVLKLFLKQKLSYVVLVVF